MVTGFKMYEYCYLSFFFTWSSSFNGAVFLELFLRIPSRQIVNHLSIVFHIFSLVNGEKWTAISWAAWLLYSLKIQSLWSMDLDWQYCLIILGLRMTLGICRCLEKLLGFLRIAWGHMLKQRYVLGKPTSVYSMIPSQSWDLQRSSYMFVVMHD